MLSFLNVDCDAELIFLNCEIQQLCFYNTTLIYPPAISKRRIRGIQKLILPKKKDYKFGQLKKSYAQFTKKEDKKNFWPAQFKGFNSINTLAKDFEMHQEHGDYYALMQQCYELNQENPIHIRILSWIYGRTANYGQSILRPLIGLGVVILSYTGVYHYFCDQSWEQSKLLSVQQTIKFFNAFFDPSKDLTNAIRWICFSQSLFSVVFLAFLIFGLTWNFKKKQ